MILRIDEMDKEGAAKIKKPKAKGNVHHLPRKHKKPTPVKE